MPGAAFWYKDWFNSPYYHLLYANRDDQEAAALIDRLLDVLQPPKGSRMVDIACGRGRHARILSSVNIAYAKQFENEQLHFYEHDMRLPCWIHYFDYGFNLFTSFGYFRTDRENQDALRSFSQSLKTNGVLVIDYLNKIQAEHDLIDHSVSQIEGIEFDQNRYCDERYFYKKIRIQDPSLPEPIEFTERVAKYGIPEFERMCNAIGLKIESVFGDYQLDGFGPLISPRLILIARKAS